MIRPFAVAAPHPWRILQFIMSVCVGTAVIWFGWKALQDIDPAAFWTALDSIALWQWALSAVCVWISFAAVGRYDAQWHVILNTKTPPRLARQVGRASVAIGQTIGMGAITGGLVRWQCLPQLSVKQTSQISAAVAVSFLGGWLCFAVLSATVIGLIPFAGLLAFSLVAFPLVAALLRKFPLVRSQDIFRLAGCTGIDLLFAGTALFVLLPSGTGIDFHMLIAAFVLALGFGLIANIPAGAGVLEVTLISLLAPPDAAPVLAALCGFRLIAYIAPAIIAMGFVARLKLRPAPMMPKTAGDWDIVGQHGALTQKSNAIWLTGYPLGLPVTIGSPSARALPPVSVGCYKIDQKTALNLRKRGWAVGRIAAEAVIDPQNWAHDGPKFSGLRRKLKQARAAGVTITEATQNMPMQDMAHVAAHWAINHGGERGFSMGRFTPSYVANQRVFLIHHGGHLVGFISLQCHGANWQLDLIRHGRNMPDGGVHLAIVSAIVAAKQAGAVHLSLAAIPDCHLKIGQRFRTACKGLSQFKNGFRPQWIPLYHAAPSRVLFGFSLLVATLAIQRPAGRIMQVFTLKLWHKRATSPQRKRI